MASASDEQCYYCNSLIPAGAINCPNCGKEKRELFEIRRKCREAWLTDKIMLASEWERSQA